MNETLPQQQAVREGTQHIDGLHDAIANNDLGQRFSRTNNDGILISGGYGQVENLDQQPGRVEDVDKAHEMALAAKPGIDEVLGKVALRDHDLSPFDATITLPNGKTGALPNSQGARLVTKPHRTDLVDATGQPNRKTGVRSETYRYGDLRATIQNANLAAMEAGQAYDRRNKQ